MAQPPGNGFEEMGKSLCSPKSKGYAITYLQHQPHIMTKYGIYILWSSDQEYLEFLKINNIIICHCPEELGGEYEDFRVKASVYFKALSPEVVEQKREEMSEIYPHLDMTDDDILALCIFTNIPHNEKMAVEIPDDESSSGGTDVPASEVKTITDTQSITETTAHAESLDTEEASSSAVAPSVRYPQNIKLYWENGSLNEFKFSGKDRVSSVLKLAFLKATGREPTSRETFLSEITYKWDTDDNTRGWLTSTDFVNRKAVGRKEWLTVYGRYEVLSLTLYVSSDLTEDEILDYILDEDDENKTAIMAIANDFRDFMPDGKLITIKEFKGKTLFQLILEKQSINVVNLKEAIYQTFCRMADTKGVECPFGEDDFNVVLGLDYSEAIVTLKLKGGAGVKMTQAKRNAKIQQLNLRVQSQKKELDELKKSDNILEAQAIVEKFSTNSEKDAIQSIKGYVGGNTLENLLKIQAALSADDKSKAEVKVRNCATAFFGEKLVEIEKDCEAKMALLAVGKSVLETAFVSGCSQNDKFNFSAFRKIVDDAVIYKQGQKSSSSQGVDALAQQMADVRMG